MRYIVIILAVFLMVVVGCKNQTTGNTIVDVKDKEEYKPLEINNTNQTYFVNKTVDLSKEANIRINDAREEISKTIILLKNKVDRKLISSKNKQKAGKLINSAELLLDKAEESYSKGLYENSIDLAVESKIKITEAKSVIG